MPIDQRQPDIETRLAALEFRVQTLEAAAAKSQEEPSDESDEEVTPAAKRQLLDRFTPGQPTPQPVNPQLHLRDKALAGQPHRAPWKPAPPTSVSPSQPQAAGPPPAGQSVERDSPAQVERPQQPTVETTPTRQTARPMRTAAERSQSPPPPLVQEPPQIVNPMPIQADVAAPSSVSPVPTESVKPDESEEKGDWAEAVAWANAPRPEAHPEPPTEMVDVGAVNRQIIEQQEQSPSPQQRTLRRQDAAAERQRAVQDRSAAKSVMRKQRIATKKGEMEPDERTPEEKFSEALEWAKQRRPQQRQGGGEDRASQMFEGPDQFSVPRAHEAVPTRPGRETDGLPHETFGQTIVDVTKASTRAMERLSGELAEALARIEKIESDVEARGNC